MTVEQVFLDTGCGQTLVQKDLVPKRGMTEETVELKCVLGNMSKYPVALKELEVSGKKLTVQMECKIFYQLQFYWELMSRS